MGRVNIHFDSRPGKTTWGRLSGGKTSLSRPENAWDPPKGAEGGVGGQGGLDVSAQAAATVTWPRIDNKAEWLIKALVSKLVDGTQLYWAVQTKFKNNNEIQKRTVKKSTYFVTLKKTAYCPPQCRLFTTGPTGFTQKQWSISVSDEWSFLWLKLTWLRLTAALCQK